MLLGVKRVWGNEPSHSQVNSHVGCWSPKWPPKLSEHDCRGQNSLPWKVFYITETLLKRRCLKWARIAHLDVWNTNYGQKKGQESKLAIWLPTIKSRELTQCPCVQAASDIPLESSQQGLQLHFKPHCNRRFARQIMRLQSHESPKCGNFGTPTWESRNKKPFGCGPPWRGTKYTMRGKVVASPKSGLWWVLCVRIARGSS
jgi:hypothetical protein